MSVITTGAHPKALWPGVHEFFGANYNEYPLECVDLFDTQRSSKNYEEDVQTTGFGLAPKKSEGAALSYDSDTQGYISRYTHVAYSLGYIVTREEMADNLYLGKSFKRAKMLAFSMRQTKENVGANVYNRAFNASYTGGDGVTLLNTAHPNSTGGTFSNKLTTAAALSESSLEDVLIQIGQATDDRGLKISLVGQRLVVPINLQFTAERILKSTLQNDTANNAVNAMRSMGMLPQGYTVNHYLSSSTAWFIRTNCPDGLIHFERDPVMFEQDNDFDTKNAKASAYERYSFGWTDPRGLYGTEGA